MYLLCLVCFICLLFRLFNPLNAELNPICHLLVLLEAHPILHVSRVRVNVINLIDIMCLVLIN